MYVYINKRNIKLGKSNAFYTLTEISNPKIDLSALNGLCEVPKESSNSNEVFLFKVHRFISLELIDF